MDAHGSVGVAETVMQRALSERLAEAAAAAPHQTSHAAVARERLEARAATIPVTCSRLQASHAVPIRCADLKERALR